jgi:hypothetical protein
MNQRIKVRLSRLRDIGWTEWDPIGLCPPEGWEGIPAADEYDGYPVGPATARAEKPAWCREPSLAFGQTLDNRGGPASLPWSRPCRRPRGCNPATGIRQQAHVRGFTRAGLTGYALLN